MYHWGSYSSEIRRRDQLIRVCNCNWRRTPTGAGSSSIYDGRWEGSGDRRKGRYFHSWRKRTSRVNWTQNVQKGIFGCWVTSWGKNTGNLTWESEEFSRSFEIWTKKSLQVKKFSCQASSRRSFCLYSNCSAKGKIETLYSIPPSWPRSKIFDLSFWCYWGFLSGNGVHWRSIQEKDGPMWLW